MTEKSTHVAIIGTGIIGIATAYYLATRQGITDVLLMDVGQPMAFTSAQSGENYRNWWPHPSMVDFTNRGMGLTRFRGHLTIWEEGVHDVEKKSTLSA